MTTTHTAWLFSYRNQRTAKRMNREPRLAKLSKRWNGSLLARRNFFLFPRIFLSSSLPSNLFQKAPWNTKMGFLHLSDSPQYLLGTISKQTLYKECYNLILSKHWYIERFVTTLVRYGFVHNHGKPPGSLHLLFGWIFNPISIKQVWPLYLFLFFSLHWTESDETYLFCGNDGNVIKKLGAIWLTGRNKFLPNCPCQYFHLVRENEKINCY